MTQKSLAKKLKALKVDHASAIKEEGFADVKIGRSEYRICANGDVYHYASSAKSFIPHSRISK